jgi:hypothetical protein
LATRGVPLRDAVAVGGLKLTDRSDIRFGEKIVEIGEVEPKDE